MRVSKGIYTLRALAPPPPVQAPAKAKGQRTVRPPPPRFDPSADADPLPAYEVPRYVLDPILWHGPRCYLRCW